MSNKIQISNEKIKLYTCVICVIGIVLRLQYINHITPDVADAFIPWLQQIRANGGILSLSSSIGDYNLPYLLLLAIVSYLPFEPLYLVKSIPLFFDVVMIAGLYNIAKQYLSKEKTLLALLAFAWEPLTILDGSAWGQCDSIYASFLIWMMYFVLKENWLYVFVFFGLAFSFKLQAILVFPFLLLLYLKKRCFSVWYFGAIPISYILMCLPLFLLGRSITAISSIYGHQVTMFNLMSIWYPNIYYILGVQYNRQFYGKYYLICIGITAFIIGMGGLFKWLYDKKTLNFIDSLGFAIWSVWTSCMFLPGMHERYSFFMNVALVLYILLINKYYTLLFTLEIIGVLSYLPFCFFDASNSVGMFVVMAVFNLLLYLMYTYHIFIQHENGELSV